MYTHMFTYTPTNLHIYVDLYLERSLLNIYKSERQKLNLGAFRVAGHIAGIVLNSIY